MPGNATVSKSPKAFLPATWTKEDFTAGEAAGVAMAIGGFPAAINEMSLLRKTSLLSVAIVLSEPVTAGFIRFMITKDGADTGYTFDMDAAAGTRQVWQFNPGQVTGVKGTRVGVKWGSSAALAPSGVIDGVVFLEVQDA